MAPPTEGARKPRLLLIEDDLPLADGLRKALRREGHAVDDVTTVRDAIAALARESHDLVILDLGLPDRDGRAVVDHMNRQGIDTPVLVLSARDGLDDRVDLLDIGADDYLVKPVIMAEFLARVRAMLRRRRPLPDNQMAIGRLRLELDAKRAYLDGAAFELNGREWALMRFLAEHANQVVSRDAIVEAIYNKGEAVSENALEQTMSRFRRRLADAGLRLRTVRGLGYFLETDGVDG